MMQQGNYWGNQMGHQMQQPMGNQMGHQMQQPMGNQMGHHMQQPIVCPTQYRFHDQFTPQEIPVIHPIVNVNREHMVPVPRHFYTESTQNVNCGPVRPGFGPGFGGPGHGQGQGCGRRRGRRMGF